MLTKPEIEKSILSYLLYDNDIFFSHEVRIDYFTSTNAVIFGCIKDLIDSGGSADLVTVSTSLKGIVDISYLMSVNDFPISTNVKHSISELKTALKSRNIHKALTSGIEMCLTGSDSPEIESTVNAGFLAIDEDVIDQGEKIENAYNRLEKIASCTQSVGLPTGIKALDNELGGLGNGELVIVAGRPGVGKTSLVANFVRNFCNLGIPGLFVSLEMTTEQLSTRFVSDIASLDGSLLLKGRCAYLQKKEKERFLSDSKRAFGKILKWPITIDSRSFRTIDSIASQAKKLKATDSIEWVVIDHSRLIANWNNDGQGPKSDIVRGCKAISKDLDLPVVLLSQLNRGIEARSERTPKNSDLKDTGALEEEADIIIFPDVPEREGFTNCEEYKEACLYITKNRRGNVGKINGLKWQGHYFRYSDKYI